MMEFLNEWWELLLALGCYFIGILHGYTLNQENNKGELKNDIN